jgi:hypothetical protein
MNVTIDGVVYIVNLKKVSEHLESWWNSNKNQLDSIKMDNGKTIDFSKKSLARIGFKTLMTPIFLPMIHMLYKFKQLSPPQKEKHEDLLDYMTVAIIKFIGELDGDKLYVESMEVYNSDCRRVSSIATYEPISDRQLGQSDEHKEDTQERTGGETCFSGGEVGDGENVSYEDVDQKEIRSTAMAERLPP